MTIISASLLAANAACLGQEAQQVTMAGADWIHLDVMDNHFVPNLSFGPAVCHSIKPYCSFIDVHLMVTPIEDMIKKFATNGANAITVHAEANALSTLQSCLKLIKSYGLKTGLALKPATPISSVLPFLDCTDILLIMSVEPGFGGQKFLPQSLDRLKEAHDYIKYYKFNTLLSVDGGVTKDNSSILLQAKADILVVGSAIFNHLDYKTAICELYT